MASVRERVSYRRRPRRRAGRHHPEVGCRRRDSRGQRVRARGRVPRALRRADEGVRPLRRQDRAGARRSRSRHADLRAAHGGALIRVDVARRRAQHAHDRRQPHRATRHRGAAVALAAGYGPGRAPRRVQPLRARRRERHPGDPVPRRARRRRVHHQRHEDVGHQRRARRSRRSPRPGRPKASPASSSRRSRAPPIRASRRAGASPSSATRASKPSR